MEFKILPILAFLSVAIVVSHAALPSEEYWNSVLPNTPMPKAVKDLLHPTSEWEDENVSTDKSGGTNVNVGGGEVNVNTKNGTHVNVGGGKGGGGVSVNTKNGTHVNVGGGKGGGGVTVGSHNRKGKPVYVRVAPGPNPFQYNYAATETQLHDDPNVALFFLERDLYAGNKMNLHFSQPTNQQTSKFLPRHLADSIPFSSNKLPEIYSEFSVNPASDEAAAMKKTIQECEDAGIRGEEKLCATSLESMVDFSTSKLGKDAVALSTEADSTERKVYRIEAVTAKKSAAVVVCHQQEYAYAVFYCHKTDTTAAYEVSLVGGGGARADAVAVCHRDTAEWNPKHLAFQVLKVKPGTAPVCHFLPQNHIVWVSKE